MVRRINSIEYCAVASSKQCLDLFLPSPPAAPASRVKNNKDNKLPPVVLFVHGGGWRRGDKQAFRHYTSCRDTNALAAASMMWYGLYGNVGHALASAGIPCAVTSYRLSKLPNGIISLLEIFLSFVASLLFCATPVAALVGIWRLWQMIYGTGSGGNNHDDDGIGADAPSSSSSAAAATAAAAASAVVRGGGISNFLNGISLSSGILPFLLVGALVAFVIGINVNRAHFCLTLRARIIPLVFASFSALASSVFMGTSKRMTTIVFGVSLAAALLNLLTHLYRSSVPGVRHPQHVHDVAMAVAHITRNAHQYGFDGRRVFLCGHSAGGHLVSLLATDQQYLRDVGVDPQVICGVISISGVYDIAKLADQSRGYRLFYIEPAFGPHRSTWDDASPIHHVGRRTASSDLNSLEMKQDISSTPYAADSVSDESTKASSAAARKRGSGTRARSATAWASPSSTPRSTSLLELTARAVEQIDIKSEDSSPRANEPRRRSFSLGMKDTNPPPPFLVITAERDLRQLRLDADQFAAALRNGCHDVARHSVPGTNHFTIITKFASPLLSEVCLSFIDRVISAPDAHGPALWDKVRELRLPSEDGVQIEEDALQWL